MNEKKKELIYEGKAKKIFSTDKPDYVIQEFKDSLTAFNAQKKGEFQGKGILNLKMTTHIFEYLGKHGIVHHLVEKLNDRDMLTHKVAIVPLEVVVRNKAAGSLCQRLGLTEGVAFKKPLIEFYYKKDDLGDPLVTWEHIEMLGLATADEIKQLREQALRINDLLKDFFAKIDIEFIDFKIEFGKDRHGKLILADEITPDSCRLWDKHTHEKLDKDRFRRDLGKIKESYEFVCSKILSQ